jgi:hypothetical protein
LKTGNGDVGISYLKNNIDVVTADVMASNGVIHVIDKVILPSKFLTYRGFSPNAKFIIFQHFTKIFGLSFFRAIIFHYCDFYT